MQSREPKWWPFQERGWASHLETEDALCAVRARPSVNPELGVIFLSMVNNQMLVQSIKSRYQDGLYLGAVSSRGKRSLKIAQQFRVGEWILQPFPFS
jgi:hypothetical protein